MENEKGCDHITNSKEIEIILPECGDKANLLKLNDDCLLEIFKYLSLRDTFITIGTCTRLNSIAYQRIAKTKQLTVNMREYMPMAPYTIEELRLIGKNLKSLFLSAGYLLPADKILAILRPLTEADGCETKLEELTLCYINFNDDYKKCILYSKSTLKKLDLSCCELTERLGSELLIKLECLEELTLLGNYCLTGYLLKTLSTKFMRKLTVEVNPSWLLTMSEFAQLNRHIKMTVYEHGRGNVTFFND